MEDLQKKLDDIESKLEEYEYKFDALKSKLEDTENKLSSRMEGCFLLLGILLSVILYKVW